MTCICRRLLLAKLPAIGVTKAHAIVHGVAALKAKQAARGAEPDGYAHPEHMFLQCAYPGPKPKGEGEEALSDDGGDLVPEDQSWADSPAFLRQRGQKLARNDGD